MALSPPLEALVLNVLYEELAISCLESRSIKFGT